MPSGSRAPNPPVYFLPFHLWGFLVVHIADFIPAPNSGGDYTKVLLVIHDTECSEVAGAARDVVHYWQRARTGSTQYVVDDKEIIQAVKETAYAWAAGTTANKWGIHTEHVGFAKQSRSDWRDAYSEAELKLSAPLQAELGHKYGIPLRRINYRQVRHAVATGNPADGGLCGHDDIRLAFPGETTHTDPGPDFPWGWFIGMVQGHQEEGEVSAKDVLDALESPQGQRLLAKAAEKGVFRSDNIPAPKGEPGYGKDNPNAAFVHAVEHMWEILRHNLGEGVTIPDNSALGKRSKRKRAGLREALSNIWWESSRGKGQS